VRLRTIVWREAFERKNQLATSFLAIVLGIAAIVCIENVTYFSEKAVARELDALGVNILVLPKSASVQDYYRADLLDDTIPEEYVSRLVMSDLAGLDNLSPKLSVPVEIGGSRFTFTGILPKNEFQAKAAWQGAGIFSRPKGCGTVTGAAPPAKETLARTRVISTLAANETLIGADVAASLGVNEGGGLSLLGEQLRVTAVLPETGTIDDSRIFGHLHTVQRLAGRGPVVNAIEIVGCCVAIHQGLVQKINALLPEARVVTISQIVETQIRTNRTMARLSWVVLGVIALIGGASIANYMYANVYERRREIGTMVAMGADSSFVLRMFLLKAFVLGVVGGICGYLGGTVLAMVLGPRLLGVPVTPMPTLLALGTGISAGVAVVASYLPARRAARLDPSAALQEV
jgi:putative ABC transport system permease protein